MDFLKSTVKTFVSLSDRRRSVIEIWHILEMELEQKDEHCISGAIRTAKNVFAKNIGDIVYNGGNRYLCINIYNRNLLTEVTMRSEGLYFIFNRSINYFLLPPPTIAKVGELCSNAKNNIRYYLYTRGTTTSQSSFMRNCW